MRVFLCYVLGRHCALSFSQRVLLREAVPLARRGLPSYGYNYTHSHHILSSKIGREPVEIFVSHCETRAKSGPTERGNELNNKVELVIRTLPLERVGVSHALSYRTFCIHRNVAYSCNLLTHLLIIVDNKALK